MVSATLFSSRWLTTTGLIVNVLSLFLRREGCLPAVPGNSTVFQCLLQGDGYGNTGGMGKLEDAREGGYGASSSDAALVAEAERNPFFSTRDLKAATGFRRQKDTIIARQRSWSQHTTCCGEAASHS